MFLVIICSTSMAIENHFMNFDVLTSCGKSIFRETAVPKVAQILGTDVRLSISFAKHRPSFQEQIQLSGGHAKLLTIFFLSILHFQSCVIYLCVQSMPSVALTNRKIEHVISWKPNPDVGEQGA